MMLFSGPSTAGTLPPMGGQLFATGRLHTEPLPFDQAKAYVGRHHRHNEPPVGHVFSVGCYFDGVLVGVAIVGRPVARALDNGNTLEVTRVCTQGHPDACSKLYAACQQRARLRGCRKLITYTLQSEKASSVRGANFVLASGKAGGAKWTGKRQATRPSGATAQKLKCRWEIALEPVATAAPERDAYLPWVQRPEKAGAAFDCLIYPGRAYVHQPGLPVPPMPVQELAGLVGFAPSVAQLAELHALAHLADKAGYQLLLARLNPRFPFYLTTCRHGGQHRQSIQWCDTHLSGGDWLRVYLSRAPGVPLTGKLAERYGRK
ncbi:XF1762 family protein [Hymenobacter sp. YC55]|uniref:XF1762 family protein n=1 Tax=Hymenobacter sp. YC55 TaxID=3034019 RepID=UPI0023F87547|nr:XF1762 family protein [Hymenobacter sp. YC55]MDF7815370.1 hypothetical protein [Hymenobacter sp. YC55]